MKRVPVDEMNCSVAQFAAILGDKWSLLVIREAFKGENSFSGFERALGVAKNILSDRLTQLVGADILSRNQTRPGVERYTYELTTRGKALLPIIVTIMQWGDKWIFGNHGEPYKLVDKKTGAPIQSVSLVARDGRHIEVEDVEFVPGPGASRDSFSMK